MANEWLSSREAARRLGVSAATLYAYVSRGLLRSEAIDGRRERRYRADDIVAAEAPPRDVGRKAESIAGNALDFGTPVLESALTLIEDGRLYYRGVDAAQLARSASLEDIARLLWDCDDKPFAADNLPPMTTALRRAWIAAATLSPIDRCLVLLPAAAALDHPSWVEDRPAMLETGVRVLRLLTAAVTARPPSALPVHEQLAIAWRVPADRAAPIRAALVLSADHEFNASAFAARVVASTGANLYGATMAGLAALNGPRHGGADAPGRRAVRRPEEVPPTSMPSWPRGCATTSTFPASATCSIPTATSGPPRCSPCCARRCRNRPSSPSPSGWRPPSA